jgi:hypothetical protein
MKLLEKVAVLLDISNDRKKNPVCAYSLYTNCTIEDNKEVESLAMKT